MTVERIDLNKPHDDEVVAQHIERYKFAIQYVEGKNVLDMACGTGYGSYILAKANSQGVVGVDLDEKTIKRANKQYQSENLKFCVGDAQEVMFPSAMFDVIVSFETIEHLEFPEKHLFAVRKMLKKNGVYICSSPVREKGKEGDKPQNPFHFREWNVNEFKSLLCKYFEDVKILGQLFHFSDSYIPYNRTFTNFLCKTFFKKQYSKIYKIEIEEFPKLPVWFGCIPFFQIGICEKTDVYDNS